MSTAVLANPADMIRQGAPHVIHTDAELADYTAALFELTGKDNPTREEDEAIELLSLLIDRYETQQYPIPDVEPSEMLRFLLLQNGLSQRDIAEELGNETTVSLVLSGRRSLTREHIARLSARFHVSPAVFFPRAS
jgi:HTH-type transcriptional regulator/antitoxin HigA